MEGGEGKPRNGDGNWVLEFLIEIVWERLMEKVTYEQRHLDVVGYLRNEHSKRRRIKCKHLEVGTCLACSGVSDKAVWLK